MSILEIPGMMKGQKTPFGKSKSYNWRKQNKLFVAKEVINASILIFKPRAIEMN